MSMGPTPACSSRATASVIGSARRPTRSSAASRCWLRSRKSVPTAETANERTMTKAKARSSRELRLRSISVHHQLVTYAPDSLDLHAPGARQLVAQPGDVDIDGAGVAVVVGAPEQLEKPLPGEHDAR